MCKIGRGTCWAEHVAAVAAKEAALDQNEASANEDE
jgi:hypothetical protein